MIASRRLVAVSVPSGTVTRTDITARPYSKVSAYSVETAGTLDMDSELELYFSGVGKVKFEFTGQSNIIQIGQMISAYILR